MVSAITFGYARCSTAGQAESGYSLDYQRDLLVRAGADPERIFEDVCSGTRASRPGFDKLMSAVREGDTVIVWKLDRMGRSVRHLMEVVETFEAKGVHLRVLSENIDTTTASGKAMLGMVAVFAAFERDLLAERTREGLRAARMRGHTGGRPRVDGKSVARALRQYDSGDYSVREIADMNSMSVTTLYRYIHARENADG